MTRGDKLIALQKAGRLESCFAATLCEGKERYKLDEQEASWLAGAMV